VRQENLDLRAKLISPRYALGDRCYTAQKDVCDRQAAIINRLQSNQLSISAVCVAGYDVCSGTDPGNSWRLKVTVRTFE
jgi:hypothetical protein